MGRSTLSAQRVWKLRVPLRKALRNTHRRPGAKRSRHDHPSGGNGNLLAGFPDIALSPNVPRCHRLQWSTGKNQCSGMGVFFMSFPLPMCKVHNVFGREIAQARRGVNGKPSWPRTPSPGTNRADPFRAWRNSPNSTGSSLPAGTSCWTISRSRHPGGERPNPRKKELQNTSCRLRVALTICKNRRKFLS